MKSVSSPSIPSIKDEDKQKGTDRKSSPASEGAPEPVHAQLARLPLEEEPDEDELLNTFLQRERTSRARMSMIEFLNDPTNFEEDDVDRPKRETKEEQKKRRPSVFSKFGSYRQRKLAKDSKSKNTHQFVSVSFSNSTACDVCNKFMANKAALQCENCMVNVHENSCKDQIAQCSRFKHPKLQHRDSVKEKMSKYQSSSLPGGSASVRGSNSIKERTRATSVPARPLQFSQTINAQPRQNSPGKVISEEREKEKDGKKDDQKDKDSSELVHQMQLQIETTNITDTMSVSMESLDEGAAEIVDFEDDPDLVVKVQEAEAWSVTVDKKTLKKMSAKDIKRQDHIWELIQTEERHCRTLKIMQKIFSRGMQNEVHMSQDMIDRIFPRLDELIDIHVTYLHALTERQKLRPDRSIDDISDILVQQFEGDMGDRMKVAYGEFCSRHNEAVQLYKDIFKNDRKFQNFIKKCSRNSLCKRLSIPECILLVTQRMTKYPLLIEPIIKTTKEASRHLFADIRPEHARLKRAFDLARQILNYVDAQVDARAKEQRLIEIYNKLDARSYAIYKGAKFKKSDLLSNNRKLLSEGTIRWMSARGKAFEVLAVILSDVVFFLSENNQKYTFFSQDNKSSVVSLSKLLVREKGDTKDSKGIYLICQSKTEPEMYELVCRSADERKAWIAAIRRTIAKCPEEDDGVPSESEEERKLQAARTARLRQLINQLYEKDNAIRSCCDEKMKVMLDMRDLFIREDVGDNLRSVYKDEEGQEMMEPEELLQAALREGSKLYMLLQSSGSNLSRSVSSVGEHESGTYHTPPLPKRAETFSGFEAKEKDKNLAATKRAETFAGFEAKERDLFKPIKKRYSSGGRDSETLSGSSGDSQVIVMPGVHRETDLDNLLMPAEGPRSVTSRRGSCGTPVAHEVTRQSNNKDRMSRRMSTSFLQNLLIKQHNEKEETESQKSSSTDRGSVGSSIGDLLPSPITGATSILMPPPTKEQLQSLLQLLHYVQALVCIATQQGTEVESFRSQLKQTNEEINRIRSEAERLAHDRKHVYHHDKQLEELRNLQESINQERAQWDKTKEKQLVDIDSEREQLKTAQQELQKEKDEIRAQRDRLLREKEALQRQMDLFEQVKSQSSVPEPYSPGSGLDSPGLHRASWTPDSPSIRPAPPSSVPQALWDTFVHHKRSSSEDLQKNQGDSFEPMMQEYSSSLKEPLTGSRDSREPHRETHKNRSDSRSRSDSRTRHQYSPQGGGGGGGSSGGSGHRDSIGVGKQREVNLPIHLMSATNEQKMGQFGGQQLPLKLVEQGGGSKTMSHQQSASGVQQMLPFKLSSDIGVHTAAPPMAAATTTTSDTTAQGTSTPPSSGTPHHHHHHHHSNFHQNAVPSSSSHPVKHATLPPNMNIVSPSSAVSSSPPGPSDNTHTHSSTQGAPRVLPGRSQPMPISGLRHQQSQPSLTHSILPMKLATQKRPKSASPSPNTSSRSHSGATATTSATDTPKTSSKHSQKSSRKEQEIIYF